MFREAAEMGVLQVHLSGGEPASRRDLVEIAAAGARGGALHQPDHLGDRARRDAAGAAAARPGSTTCSSPSRTWTPQRRPDRRLSRRARAQAGVCASEWSRLGLALTVNAVIHRANIERVAAMVELAASLGAGRVEIAHAQYYGWALRNRDGADADARAGRPRRCRRSRRSGRATPAGW